MKKIILITVAFVLICNSVLATVMPYTASNTSLSEMIIGKWADKNSFSILSASAVTEYLPNGTTNMDATVRIRRLKFKVTIKGSWKIVGRQLTMIATESSHPRLYPPGRVTTDEIVSISPTEMTLLGKDGKRQVSERVR